MNKVIVIGALFVLNLQLSQSITTGPSSRSTSYYPTTTRQPDYSDIYDKINENDIFRNVRRIIRYGDPANNVPRLAPFSRTLNSESDLGDLDEQQIQGLDEFITKSSLIYSNDQKFDFTLLWPQIVFTSRHSSQNSRRIFYSNYTFVGSTMKGECDVERTNDEGCFRLNKIHLTLHFKSYEIEVKPDGFGSTSEDYEVARLAKNTLDRFIQQEYTLGLEKQAFDLEKKIKEYFGTYRCIIEDENTSRATRNNRRTSDIVFQDYDRRQPSTIRSERTGTRFVYT